MIGLDSYTPGGGVIIRREKLGRERNLDRGSAFSYQRSVERAVIRATRLANRMRRVQEKDLSKLAHKVQAERALPAKSAEQMVHIALPYLSTASAGLRYMAKAIRLLHRTTHPIRTIRMRRLHISPSLTVRRSIMQSTFTLKDHLGSSVAFSLQGGSDDAKGNRSSYAASALSTAGAPVLLKFENQVKPIGSEGSDKHRAMVQYVVRDAQNRPHVFSATMTWSVPRLPASMNPEDTAKDALYFLVGAIAQAQASSAKAGDVGTYTGEVEPTTGVLAMVDNLLP